MYNPPGATLYESPLMLQFIELLPSLKPASRKVAEFILREPLQAATMNIHELGARTCSSTAAVHRFAKASGFDGFIGLRHALLSNLRGWVSPGVEIRDEVLDLADGHFSLRQQVRQAKHNLDAVVDSNPQAVFEATVAAMESARRLYIIGFGNSFHLAALLGAFLIPFGNDVCVVSNEGGLEFTAHRIAAITADDALLALSLPPYTRETIQLARYAKSRGARILALTDAPISPLAALADHALFAPPTHPVLRNSKIALLGVIEALVAAVQLRHQPRIDLALDQANEAQVYLYGEDLAADEPLAVKAEDGE
jgi:DNA-binding MurR/RpiR family transcriptional regulator